MKILLWIILFFYIFLMIIHLIPSETKISFTKLNNKFYSSLPNQNCTTDSDCNNSEKCFHTKCYPTYRGTTHCNPLTGSWVLEQINNRHFLKCSCRYPNLISQKFEGATCDVDIACGPFGSLKTLFLQSLDEAECICKTGYKPLDYPQLGCVKMLPSEIEKTVCEDSEYSILEAQKVFHFDYLNNLPPVKKCIKKPCSFNVFNNKPLKHTKFDINFGCICNPLYGNFGVKFENTSNYLLSPGYDACANIFIQEPDKKVKVDLYTYFYINGKEPVSFLQFIYLKKDQLVPELQNVVKSHKLQIGEIWPYNYSQYIFEKENFTVHTRECFLETFLCIENCYERIMKENQMINCDLILDQVPDIENVHLQTYALFYKYPVCKYTNFLKNNNMYYNRYILNPYFLSFEETPNLIRSNGIEISHNNNKWVVSLAPTNFERYVGASVYPPLAEPTFNVEQTPLFLTYSSKKEKAIH